LKIPVAFFPVGLSFLIGLNGCSLSEPETKNPAPKLKLVHEYKLKVPEPSGLCFAEDYNSLWLVSDQTGNMYRLNLSGEILETIELQGDDLEGLDLNRVTGEWIVAEERSGLLKFTDARGQVLRQVEILTTRDNSGLEGCCADRSGSVFALKEKNPGRWFALQDNGKVQAQTDLKFARDFSDITADTCLNRFWILSDEDQSLFLWDALQGIIETWKIPVENPEGLAVNFRTGEIFIVSDASAGLYIFKK